MSCRIAPAVVCGLVLAIISSVRAADAAELSFRRHDINAKSTYSACAAVDVNKDGKLDIVCGGWWYEAPTWKRHFLRDVEVIRGRYDDYSNLPLDVNGDGWLDLVSANYRSRKLYWIEHPGKKLGPWKTHLIDTPGPMETARLVDVDGDGRTDVLPNGTQSAFWWEFRPGKPKPTWVRHDLPKELAGHGLGFGDIDGDGRNDLVGPRGWAAAPPDRRKDRWIWHNEFELHRDGSIPILVFDVDGDGDNDLVWGRAHNIGMYWAEQVQTQTAAGKPRRDWAQHAIDTSWSQPHSLLLADLDNDKQPEVIAGKRYLGHDGKDPGEYDPLMVYAYSFQPKSRTWRRRLISASTAVGFGLDPKAADLDADGDIDLLCPGRSGLFWLENLLVNKSKADRNNLPLPHLHYKDHSELLVAADREVKTPFDWALRRSHIVDNVEDVMGDLPDPSRRVPLDVKVVKEESTEHYIRRTITYAADPKNLAPGDRVPAYLLIPRNLKRKAPAMLCLHQTTRIGKGEPAGLGGKPSLHYAHELAKRGYVCLAPDYPSFGDYKFDFKARGRLPSGSMKAIWNNVRAVDLLESLPQVDPDRIGCIGHSLGGHNTIFTAVFDQRIKAMVSSCGFTAFHHYYGGKLAGWTSDRYMPRIRTQYNNDPDKVPFDFHELVGALAPRPFFVNAPVRDSNFDLTGVKKVIAAAGKVYGLRGAEDRLKAVYPESGHDFPDDVRKQAYAWLDGYLKD